MKKVIFEKIRIRNFLSYGPEPTELIFQDGINFITGFNKDDNSYNGVGKTSLIVESLSFVLFGETYRKINQGEIKNDGAKDGCIVEVWYSVNGVQYEVVRSLSPNELTRYIVHDDGRREDKTKTKPETTKDIIEDLGITKEVFKNTIVMTSKESSSFLSQDKTLKTKFIEGILGLEVFSKLAKEAKDEHAAKSTETGKEEARVQELVQSLERDRTYAEAHENKKQAATADCDNLIAQLKSVQPIDLTLELEQIERDFVLKETSLKDVREKYQKAQVKRAEIAVDMQHLKKKLSSYAEIKKSCPTCKRPFEENHEHDFEEEKTQVSNEINDRQLKLNKLDNVIQILTNNVSITENEVSQLKNKRASTTEQQNRFHKSQQKLLDIVKERMNIKNSTNPFTEKVAKDTEYLVEKRGALDKLKEEVKILDGVRIAFSHTGVKAHITSKILDVVNERLNFYLDRLNTPCTIQFDEFFEETVYNRQGKKISYDRLSDGEKGRVCFSMLFTFRDIRRLQSNVTVNISVFDELFDSSIDIKATEEIMELLKTTSTQNQEAYYIITHKPDNILILDCNIIHLEKSNGTTKVI